MDLRSRPVEEVHHGVRPELRDRLSLLTRQAEATDSGDSQRQRLGDEREPYRRIGGQPWLDLPESIGESLDQGLPCTLNSLCYVGVHSRLDESLETSPAHIGPTWAQDCEDKISDSISRWPGRLERGEQPIEVGLGDTLEEVSVRLSDHLILAPLGEVPIHERMGDADGLGDLLDLYVLTTAQDRSRGLDECLPPVTALDRHAPTVLRLEYVCDFMSQLRPPTAGGDATLDWAIK